MADAAETALEAARYGVRQHLLYALDECNRALLQARRAPLTQDEIKAVEECGLKVRDGLRALAKYLD